MRSLSPMVYLLQRTLLCSCAHNLAVFIEKALGLAGLWILGGSHPLDWLSGSCSYFSRLLVKTSHLNGKRRFASLQRRKTGIQRCESPNANSLGLRKTRTCERGAPAS